MAGYIGYLYSKPQDIFEAANRGDVEAVTKFLDEGIDPNIKSSYSGWTPLYRAVVPNKGKHDVIKLLLSRGANINSRDNSGQTPLHFASSKETAELLLSMGADINAARSDDGFTALHGALETGDNALIQLLISEGANLEAKYNGNTALLRTVDPSIIELMLKHGANINARDEDRATPLHNAARCGSAAIVELLIANGAIVNTVTIYGETPLDEAEIAAKPENAVLLRKHGGKMGKELSIDINKSYDAYKLLKYDCTTFSKKAFERAPKFP